MRFPEIDKAMLAERMVSYIDYSRNYRNPHLTMAIVAKDLGVARSTLEKMMSEAMGVTFHTYLDQCRLRHARQMLISDQHNMTVEEVYLLCGFKTRRTFSQKYKKTYGERPCRKHVFC